MDKIVWLGQAGLYMELNNKKIIIDPYLSDSVKEVNPNNYRRVKVDESFFNIKPDIMIFTHDHLDHYDPETVKHFITKDTDILVLTPLSVWNKVRAIGGKNNYVLIEPDALWTENNIVFKFVNAYHSDSYAVGVIIEWKNKKYYITGDTLYNEKMFKNIPKDIYAVFLPVNGVGNNMNMVDGKKFCEKISPNFAVPFHCGMFDNIDLNKFDYKNKVVPQIYKEIKFLGEEKWK